MSDRWRRVRSIFERAVVFDEPAREVWLAEACGNDDELLAELHVMLEADVAADSWLDRGAVSLGLEHWMVGRGLGRLGLIVEARRFFALSERELLAVAGYLAGLHGTETGRFP